MSRLTQTALASPERPSLPTGHCVSDKVSWLPEGRVFSNVQREKMLSKFLKGSLLKRVFRAQQAKWERPEPHGEDPTPAFPGTGKKAEAEAKAEPTGDGAKDTGVDAWTRRAVGTLRRQRSSSTKTGRRNGEHCGTGVSQENLSHWSLDSEVPVPENKNLPPGSDSTAGGKINKNHVEIPVEQMMLELTLLEHTTKRTQNCKQGVNQLWSYPVNEGSIMENRELKKSEVEPGFSITTNPVSLFTPNHPVTSTPADKQVGSHPGQPMPWGLCWPYADGDFLKDRSECHMNSCPTAENSGDTSSAPNWNLKYGNGSVEENLTDESDLSDSEKADDALLSYFKKMDLDLTPDTIENAEESFTGEPSEVFLYPDFLPAPFNTLDLHKFALSRCENWKATVGVPETSIEHLVTRLLELERLQHMTIQRERPRFQSAFCTPVTSERPSSSKTLLKARQPKLPDSVCLQMSSVDKSREKRKSNSVSGKPEQNVLRWNWGNAGKYNKWNSRPPSLRSSSATKQVMAAYDDFKSPKITILNPGQEIPPKPAAAQSTPSLVKMVSTRCLPPRSPVPVSPVTLSFPDNQRENIKAPRTRKKLYPKTILLSRPFYIQKLNCLSPSFIAKGKCSPIDLN